MVDKLLIEARSKIDLFERCYDFEASQTPEEQRNTCSSHSDKLIFEALRLGGPTGTPRGLYPISVVASIYDKVASDVTPEPATVQEEDLYRREVEIVKARIKEYGVHNVGVVSRF
jgi:hypothetical protein